MDTSEPLIWLLSDDLIDSSKTIAHARSVGFRVKRLRSGVELAAANGESPVAIILDLQTPGFEVEVLIRDLPHPRPRLIAYGSHVDAARLSIARKAGCDLVMPRSRYFEEVSTQMKVWVGIDGT